MAIDAAVRQVHRELKYTVDAAEADRIERALEKEIPLRGRFAGERGSLVRSVYLDYGDRALTTRTLAMPEDSTKVRYKRYEDPARRMRTMDVSVWLEVKVRRGDMVTKERVPYPGVMLGELLNGNRPPPEAQYLRFILSHGALHPVVGVRYLRVAFEEPDESLRITIDRNVTFQRAQDPHANGETVSTLDACIVEVKPMRDIPTWFDRIMNGHVVSGISKFENGIRALRLAELP
jgi:hypothetical protein